MFYHLYIFIKSFLLFMYCRILSLIIYRAMILLFSDNLRAVQISPANLDDLDNILSSMSIHWDKEQFKGEEDDEEMESDALDLDADMFEKDKNFRNMHRPYVTKAENEAELDRVMNSEDWIESKYYIQLHYSMLVFLYFST